MVCCIGKDATKSAMSFLTTSMRGALARQGFAFSLRSIRLFGNSGSLHLTLEPLEKENEGIFQMTLTRHEARNAIGDARIPRSASACSAMPSCAQLNSSPVRVWGTSQKTFQIYEMITKPFHAPLPIAEDCQIIALQEGSY
jgi:hypothetical protein